jgi:hypothetical protein
MPDERGRSRWRWLKPTLKWLALVLLVLIGAGLGIRAYVIHKSDKDLQEVMDELDRTDPGWRWDEIQAAREVIPPEENSAPILLAAKDLIPQGWPTKPAVGQPLPNGNEPMQQSERPDLFTLILRPAPNERLGDDLVEEARTAIAEVTKALAQLRKVRNLPKGRYELVLSRNPICTPLPHAEKLRTSVALLEIDAVVLAHDRNFEGATESAHAALNAARSLGDDSIQICTLVRMACGTIAVRTLERTVGQGELSDVSLQGLAKLLACEQDEIGPALRTAMRGERAIFLQLMEMMTSGELTLEEMAGSSSVPLSKNELYRWAWERPIISLNRRSLLDYMTRLVDLSDLPRTQREPRLAQFDTDMKTALTEGRARNAIACRIIPAVQVAFRSFDRYQATLRTARVAIAVERYRLAHKGKQWPDKLDQLVPAYLDKVPTDPFDDQPIRYRRAGKDVIIYSVGMDCVDDGGFFDPEHQFMPGNDIVFRLYHPDNRGVPAKPKPPPEPPDMP